jgi:hypothetical protein
LDGERDAVGPLVGSVGHGLEYTGGEELADDPAEVDVGLEIVSFTQGTPC